MPGSRSTVTTSVSVLEVAVNMSLTTVMGKQNILVCFSFYSCWGHMRLVCAEVQRIENAVHLLVHFQYLFLTSFCRPSCWSWSSSPTPWWSPSPSMTRSYTPSPTLASAAWPWLTSSLQLPGLSSSYWYFYQLQEFYQLSALAGVLAFYYYN